MSPDGDPPVVLVAEDLSIVRRPVSLFLRRRGYQVLEAVDGRAALDHLEGGRVDVVLLDLSMPVVDGYGVLARLRELPAPPPAIVYTSHPLRANIERAIELGAHEVVIKGTQTLTALIERVEAALTRGSARAASQEAHP